MLEPSASGSNLTRSVGMAPVTAGMLATSLAATHSCRAALGYSATENRPLHKETEKPQAE